MDLVGFLFLGGFGAVAAFASVAAWHPDGFDRLPVGEGDEVTLGSVDRLGGLGDLGEADLVPFGGEPVAEGDGEGGDLVEGLEVLAVEGVVELDGAIFFFAKVDRDGGEVFEGEAEEGFGEWCGGCRVVVHAGVPPPPQKVSKSVV